MVVNAPRVRLSRRSGVGLRGFADNIVVTEEAASLESLPALHDRLCYLLNQWDPIGVYVEAPTGRAVPPAALVHDRQVTA